MQNWKLHEQEAVKKAEQHARVERVPQAAFLACEWFEAANCFRVVDKIQWYSSLSVALYKGRKMKQIIFLILLAIFFSGCSSSLEYELEEAQDRIKELESKIETIESKFDEVKSKADAVESAVHNLKSEIDDFSDENWRDNVPEVEDTANNIESALDDLKSEINDIEYEF